MRYFSMFSGIGGFELGIERAAMKTGTPHLNVGFSEIDKHALYTYTHHFNHWNFGDATKLDPADVQDFDLLVAGFPCQSFSIGGNKQGFNDVRGTLFFDIVRVLQEKEPQNFILENVKGLIGHDRGRTFRTIIRVLVDLGYSVEWKVLNSKDFGVPHSRTRVYIVGHLGGPPRSQILPRSGPSNPHTVFGLTTETAVVRPLTAGGHSGGNHSGMTILRTGDQLRRLTITEWERLQGFPDDWTIGILTQRFKQLGNAVTVPVVEHIATRLINLRSNHVTLDHPERIPSTGS